MLPGFSKKEISIIYIDEDIVIVNKPAPLLTIQDGYHPELPNLKRILTDQIGPVWVVHRLDQHTSGTIIFARTQQAHRNLNIQFENRQVKKKYQAIVMGNPPWDKKEIDARLLVNGDRKHRTIIDEKRGKPAATSVIVVNRISTMALVNALPYSGYTHQIRAHLAFCNYPIMNDLLYSKSQHPSEVHNFISRIALHALEITFFHPKEKGLVSFKAPYPDDFSSAITTLFK